MESYFILFVEDQKRSRVFYAAALGIQPRLDVPGMTEFTLPTGGVLGLMPAAGIKRLLGDSIAEPMDGSDFPSAELYLLLEEPERYHERAVGAGARELSGFKPRNWGHTAAYSQDFDGHILAFARITVAGG